ncbi:hypothetical protein N8303_08075 [Gammaproteobacteria bacterium]|nr:hypothetical protein [Gammaproteobacteria bacterium]
MKKITLLIVLLSNLFINPVLAQNQPCTSEDGFSAFDFWVGEWDVYLNNSANTNQVGSNTIEKLEAGCALLETWTGAGGSSGISINYYNPVRDEWRQLWVSAGEYAIDIVGGISNTSMVLIGEIYNYADNETFDFRGTWTPNSDGSVRQYFEQYNDETDAWDPWFDGRYVPQSMN